MLSDRTVASGPGQKVRSEILDGSYWAVEQKLSWTRKAKYLFE